MDIDLNLYRFFCSVAKNKSMTKASEELFVSQPAISQSIKKLEDQLGGTLFLRSNKGMELTKEGEMVYSYASRALELFNNAENEFTSFKELEMGEINVGASTTLTKIYLMDYLKDFHLKYPKVIINIKNDLTNNLLIDLEKGKLDFVFFNEGESQNTNLDLYKFKELKHGFFYNPDYYKDTITTLDQLDSLPLILQANDSNSRQFLNNQLLKQGIKLHPKNEVVSQDLLLEFVNSGFGYGYAISKLAKKYYPNLKELSINNKLNNSYIYIAKNKNINLPFASKTLLEFITKNKALTY